MDVEALVQIKFGPEADMHKVVRDIGEKSVVQWVRLAFGPTADAVAYVIAPDNLTIANLIVAINAIDGVGGTVTQIMVKSQN
jgi:hypothetical protein